jgi:hypothetical protein
MQVRPLFTAGTLAIGLALGGFAPAPARAGDGDAARIIGGIVALGLIAKALEDDDDAPPYGHANRPYRSHGYAAQRRQFEAERAYQRQLEADRAYQRQLRADRAYQRQLQADRAYQRQLEEQRRARLAERAYRRQLEADRLARLRQQQQYRQRQAQARDDTGRAYGRGYINDTDRQAQRMGFPPGSLISPNH